MRRALLLSGLAAGSAILFTTALFFQPSREEKIKTHFEKVRDLAFCQKAYEIASSFPSYESRKVVDIQTRKTLVKQSDELDSKSKELNKILEDDFKDKALALGVSEEQYQEQLEEIKSQAEIDAVLAFKSAEVPDEVLSQLEEVCQEIMQS